MGLFGYFKLWQLALFASLFLGGCSNTQQQLVDQMNTATYVSSVSSSYVHTSKVLIYTPQTEVSKASYSGSLVDDAQTADLSASFASILKNHLSSEGLAVVNSSGTTIQLEPYLLKKVGFVQSKIYKDSKLSEIYKKGLTYSILKVSLDSIRTLGFDYVLFAEINISSTDTRALAMSTLADIATRNYPLSSSLLLPKIKNRESAYSLLLANVATGEVIWSNTSYKSADKASVASELFSANKQLLNSMLIEFPLVIDNKN
jgi:hypothetical protein